MSVLTSLVLPEEETTERTLGDRTRTDDGDRDGDATDDGLTG
jgi:hypothetical protein